MAIEIVESWLILAAETVIGVGAFWATYGFVNPLLGRWKRLNDTAVIDLQVPAKPQKTKATTGNNRIKSGISEAVEA